MIRKLRIKFVLITMSFVTVILLAVAVGICLFFVETAHRRSEMALQAMLRRPPGQGAPGLEIGGETPEGFQRDPSFVMVIDGEGRSELLYADHVTISDTLLNEIAQAVQAGRKQGGELRQYDLRYCTETRNGITLVALVDTREEAKMIAEVIQGAGLMGFCALLVFLAASVLLSRWALKPVERSWQQQRRFVSDASHELKTPLTVILANTGILKAHPEDTLNTQMNWVENTEQEALRMKGLVDDLLFLSKSDDVGLQLAVGDVNLSDVVDAAALRFESKAYEQGVLLQADIIQGVNVRGDRTQLEQLVAILLDNAIKYAKHGSTVNLSVSVHGAAAHFSVHNVGLSIEDAEKKHLFDRFYRVDESRSTEGYGLGLSIAKTIVDAHKGKIQMESGEKNGTCFSVTLPLQ